MLKLFFLNNPKVLVNLFTMWTPPPFFLKMPIKNYGKLPRPALSKSTTTVRSLSPSSGCMGKSPFSIRCTALPVGLWKATRDTILDDPNKKNPSTMCFLFNNGPPAAVSDRHLLPRLGPYSAPPWVDSLVALSENWGGFEYSIEELNWEIVIESGIPNNKTHLMAFLASEFCTSLSFSKTSFWHNWLCRTIQGDALTPHCFSGWQWSPRWWAGWKSDLTQPLASLWGCWNQSCRGSACCQSTARSRNSSHTTWGVPATIAVLMAQYCSSAMIGLYAVDDILYISLKKLGMDK